MAEVKPEAVDSSTNNQETNTVELKRDYFLPTYGVVVEATSADESVKVAEQQANASDKQE